MTSIASRLGRMQPVAQTLTQPLASLRFDWLSVVLSAWLIGGAYLDGWAHNHLRASLESFFTPWHAVLYSGFLVCAAFIVGTHTRNRMRGYSWLRALPAGYELSLLGVIIFALGGLADLLWHTIFGIEFGVEALLSPTHHLLVIGIALIASGPLRAAWQRTPDAPRLAAMLPMILSVTLTLSIITFIAQGVSPLVYPISTVANVSTSGRVRDAFQMLGVAQTVIQTALLMGFVLLMIRRWGNQLPFGAFTLALTLNSLLLSTQLYEFRFIPAMMLGGIIFDVLLRWLQPSALKINRVRVFAFVAPLLLYVFYFVTLALTDQIWWKVHSVSGAIFAAGATGFLLSYLVFPPSLPANQAGQVPAVS